MKCIDIFGKNFLLNYNGSSLYKSEFGGIITIFYMIIFTLCFFFFGRDIFERRRPEVITNEQNVEFPQINLSSFFFIIKRFSLYITGFRI
jgi:D-alanyl-lipoteichoic acid acyltransferase DltB (MBOAT superfamily)